MEGWGVARSYYGHLVSKERKEVCGVVLQTGGTLTLNTHLG
jgi:hypothetical protein